MFNKKRIGSFGSAQLENAINPWSVVAALGREIEVGDEMQGSKLFEKRG